MHSTRLARAPAAGTGAVVRAVVAAGAVVEDDTDHGDAVQGRAHRWLQLDGRPGGYFRPGKMVPVLIRTAVAALRSSTSNG